MKRAYEHTYFYQGAGIQVMTGSLRGMTISLPVINAKTTSACNQQLSQNDGQAKLPPRYRVSQPPAEPIIDAISGRRLAKASKGRVFKTALSILFYLALVVAVVVAFQMSSSKGAPRIVLGYSVMTVLSGSMAPEIPKGALIINKQVDLNSIQVGDDITFMIDEKTTVTHRVIAIVENHNKTGKRGFQTQGIANLAVDRDIVHADNVVGKVIFHDKNIGMAVNFVMTHPLLIGVILALVFGLFATLRVVFARPEAVVKLR